MPDPRSHYVYKVFNRSTGEYYIGKRSCVGLPLEDNYMGSGVVVSRKVRKHPEQWEKAIIIECESEEAAYAQEALVIGDLWETDPLCLNLRGGGIGTTSRSAQEVWNKHRDKLLAGQRRIPMEERRRRGEKTQALHGERIVANLNRWAKSEEGREVVAESKRAMWSDPERRESLCKAMVAARSKASYKQSRRRCVKMMYNGMELEVAREGVRDLLLDGATFKQPYVHLHNDKLGVWTEGVASWKAARLYILNIGWQYGKNRSLRRVSITNINLDTGRENNA